MDPNTDPQQPAAATTPPTGSEAPAETAAATKGGGKKAAAGTPQPTDQLLADTPAAATTPEPPAPLPEQVELAAPHGFIDEETGAHRFWPAGAIVKAEDEIKLLLSRLAPLVGIDYKD